MRVRAEDFERRTAGHPWLAAIPFAITAGVVCAMIALLTGGPATGTGVGIPAALASWMILGSRLRLASSLERLERDRSDGLENRAPTRR